MKRALLYGVLPVILGLSLAACTRNQVATGVGAGACAVVGAAVTGGSPVGAVVGAGAGALAGSAIERSSRR